MSVAAAEAHRIDQRPSVVVYEPNGVNPYGAELACLLADEGWRVDLLTARDAQWRPPVAHRAVLPASGSRRAHVLQGVDQIVGPVRAALAARRRGGILLVVWTRGPWDEWVLSWAARRVPTVVVQHNPDGREQLGRWRSRARRRLLDRAVPVVHSAELLTCVDPERRARYAVVQHLPYVRWREWASGLGEPPGPRSSGGVPRFLLMGAPRADKGVGGLSDVVASLAGTGVEVAVCGKGSVDAWLPDWPAHTDRSFVVDRTSPEFMPAGEWAAELTQADCLLAPYTRATQSGTVAMALTWGLGVIAYGSGGIADLLRPECVVPVGDAAELTRRVLAYAREPESRPPAAKESVSDWRAGVALGWTQVLERALGAGVEPTRQAADVV